MYVGLIQLIENSSLRSFIGTRFLRHTALIRQADTGHHLVGCFCGLVLGAHGMGGTAWHRPVLPFTLRGVRTCSRKKRPEEPTGTHSGGG